MDMHDDIISTHCRDWFALVVPFFFLSLSQLKALTTIWITLYSWVLFFFSSFKMYNYRMDWSTGRTGHMWFDIVSYCKQIANTFSNSLVGNSSLCTFFPKTSSTHRCLLKQNIIYRSEKFVWSVQMGCILIAWKFTYSNPPKSLLQWNQHVLVFAWIYAIDFKLLFFHIDCRWYLISFYFSCYIDVQWQKLTKGKLARV